MATELFGVGDGDTEIRTFLAHPPEFSALTTNELTRPRVLRVGNALKSCSSAFRTVKEVDGGLPSFCLDLCEV